jgi:hypothetical protein
MKKSLLLKFSKGTFALLTLSFLLFIVLTCFQACTKENNYVEKRNPEVELKLNAFKLALSNTKSEIAQMKQKEVVSLSTKSTFSDYSFFDYSNYFVSSVHYPAIELVRSYGITDEDIIEELGSLDSAKIVLTAESILASESLIDNGKTLTFFEPEDLSYAALSFIGIQPAFAETIGGCFADAVGIVAAFEFVEHGIAGLGRKGVIKLLRKVAGKYLGPIGVALAAYDFAECMYWV